MAAINVKNDTTEWCQISSNRNPGVTFFTERDVSTQKDDDHCFDVSFDSNRWSRKPLPPSPAGNLSYHVNAHFCMFKIHYKL